MWFEVEMRIDCGFWQSNSGFSGISRSVSQRKVLPPVVLALGSNGRAGELNVSAVMESTLKELRDGNTVLEVDSKSAVSGGVRDVQGEDAATEDQIVTPWTITVARSDWSTMAIESRLSFLLFFTFCPSLWVLIILMFLFLSDSLCHSVIYCLIVSCNFPWQSSLLYVIKFCMCLSDLNFSFLNSIPAILHLAMLSFWFMNYIFLVFWLTILYFCLIDFSVLFITCICLKWNICSFWIWFLSKCLYLWWGVIGFFLAWLHFLFYKNEYNILQVVHSYLLL